MSKKKLLTDALTQILATGSLDPETVVPKAAEAATPTPEADPASVPVVPEAVASTPADGLTEYLKAEITSLKAALAEKELASTALQAKVAAYSVDNVVGLKAALGSIIKQISVPLNATVIGVDEFNGAQLVGTFNELQAKLSAHFKPGAKSTAASDEPDNLDVKKAPPPPARLTSAARFK